MVHSLNVKHFQRVANHWVATVNELLKMPLAELGARKTGAWAGPG